MPPHCIGDRVKRAYWRRRTWRHRVAYCVVKTVGTCALLAFPALSYLQASEYDPATGLVLQQGWQDVRAHCGGCHSYSVVTNQRANRDGWLNTIRWMQRTQKLWEIPAETETRILDYLAANYGPSESTRPRRAPLAKELMPQLHDENAPRSKSQ